MGMLRPHHYKIYGWELDSEHESAVEELYSWYCDYEEELGVEMLITNGDDRGYGFWVGAIVEELEMGEAFVMTPEKEEKAKSNLAQFLSLAEEKGLIAFENVVDSIKLTEPKFMNGERSL